MIATTNWEAAHCVSCCDERTSHPHTAVYRTKYEGVYIRISDSQAARALDRDKTQDKTENRPHP